MRNQNITIHHSWAVFLTSWSWFCILFTDDYQIFLLPGSVYTESYVTILDGPTFNSYLCPMKFYVLRTLYCSRISSLAQLDCIGSRSKFATSTHLRSQTMSATSSSYRRSIGAYRLSLTVRHLLNSNRLTRALPFGWWQSFLTNLDVMPTDLLSTQSNKNDDDRCTGYGATADQCWGFLTWKVFHPHQFG
jgi:hypothetical protein